jgi:hypothetical protein
MINLALSFSGKPRQASMAAYRQLLAENHVEDILTDVKQNKNLDRKKELPVWLPLAECFTNGVRKAEDAVASGLYFLDIDEKGLTEQLWNKVREENLIEEFRIVYFAESAGGGTHIWAWHTLGAKMPQFKVWTKDEEEKIKRQCLCLMDEEGEVDLPLINKAIEEWDEGKRQEYLQTLRYSLDVLRRRAALNGFRAGIIAYLLEGRKETERAIKFALWYAERCLYYQLQIYGDKIDALNNKLSPQASKGNIRYLDALPKEFTKEDLVGLRLSNNESPVVKTIIYRWVKEGQIEKIGTNLWRKIC